MTKDSLDGGQDDGQDDDGHEGELVLRIVEWLDDILFLRRLCNRHGAFTAGMLTDLAPLPRPGPKDIFSNKYFHVDNSKRGGYGAFAMIDIPSGTNILIERALFSCAAYAVNKRLKRLEPHERAVFDSLSVHYKAGENKDHRKNRAIFATNRFFTRGYGLDEISSIFPAAARFNHACLGAEKVDWIVQSAQGFGIIIVLTTKRYVSAGQELTISYTDKNDAPEYLYAEFGFKCDCGACKPISEERAREIDDIIWTG